MRKIYLLPIILVASASLQAQSTLYFEDFEDNSLSGFTLYNLDGLTPDDPELANMADSAWIIQVITAQGWTNNRSAFSVSWYVGDAGPSNDWLVTPAIDLGSASLLEWDALAITSSGNFRDQYQVFVSPGNSLDQLADDAILIFDTGLDGEEATPQHRTVDLASLGFENETVYIAFRNFTQPFTGAGTGGNELAIDNIQVSGILSTREQELATSFSVYPNPSAGNAQLEFSLRDASDLRLDIVDITGRLVRSENRGQFSAGVNRLALSRGNLAGGVYFVRLVSGDAASTARIIFE